MGPLATLGLFGLGLGVTVAIASAGSSSEPEPPPGGLTRPPPKRVGRRLTGYKPATLRATAPGAPAPQRNTAPDGLTWQEFSGSLIIGSMRKQGRDAPPGIDTLDLAEVYSGAGPVRVLCDAYVLDYQPGVGSAARAVANVAISHLNTGARFDASVRTEQAERIVRDFSTSNDGLVEGLQTTALLDHNEADPPRLPGFYGADCHIGNIIAEDMLYHYDDCRGSGREREGKSPHAYPYEFTAIDGKVVVTVNRTYNLSLEARSDGNVYLVARIMRLPVRQHLAWRAYAASEPL